MASSASSGKPNLTAGLQVLRQSTVTIDAAEGVATEDAVLIASGSVGGAGIGGGHYYSTGKIVINVGTVNATGGEKAAGLGSGDFGGVESSTVEAGEVEINGGFVTATGGQSATVDGADTMAKLGATQILKANGGTIDFNDTSHWLTGRVPKDADDILVEITAETTVMLDRQHAFGKIEVSGGKQVVFKLTNDVELTIGAAVSSDCRVNLASPKAKVCVPSATGWNNVRSAIYPDWVRYTDKDGVRTFLLRSPGRPR